MACAVRWGHNNQAMLLRVPLQRRRPLATLLWRGGLVLCVLLLALAGLWRWWPSLLLPGTRSLAMEGGDPYLRALMRTISASESNVWWPYHVLHGGGYVRSLQQHPNRCEAIGGGPNRGNCSTAAGRYQLLYGTWLELAAKHHPNRTEDPLDATQLSFEPVYQDLVVYGWLADSRAWGTDLSLQLRQGRVQPVLKRLSGTWTSLGYGIESNRMSSELPRLYEHLLREELAREG
jgi:muramidase (phage lysozyme)